MYATYVHFVSIFCFLLRDLAKCGQKGVMIYWENLLLFFTTLLLECWGHFVVSDYTPCRCRAFPASFLCTCCVINKGRWEGTSRQAQFPRAVLLRVCAYSIRTLVAFAFVSAGAPFTARCSLSVHREISHLTENRKTS